MTEVRSGEEVRPLWPRLVSWLQILAGIITVVAGILIFWEPLNRPRAPSSTPTTLQAPPQVSALEVRIRNTERQVQDVQKQMKTLEKPSNSSKLEAQVNGISRSMKQIQGDLTALNKAILQDPAKAVEIPLLRKDIEQAKANNTAAIEAIRSNVEREYDLMKLIVGALVLGILATLAQNALTAKASAKDSKTETA